MSGHRQTNGTFSGMWWTAQILRWIVDLLSMLWADCSMESKVCSNPHHSFPLSHQFDCHCSIEQPQIRFASPYMLHFILDHHDKVMTVAWTEQRVKRWNKFIQKQCPQEFDTLDGLLLPYNHNDLHWYLYVIFPIADDGQTVKVAVVDALSRHNVKQKIKVAIKWFLQCITGIKGLELIFVHWRTPQVGRGTYCGYQTALNMKCIAEQARPLAEASEDEATRLLSTMYAEADLTNLRMALRNGATRLINSQQHVWESKPPSKRNEDEDVSIIHDSDDDMKVREHTESGNGQSGNGQSGDEQNEDDESGNGQSDGDEEMSVAPVPTKPARVERLLKVASNGFWFSGRSIDDAGGWYQSGKLVAVDTAAPHFVKVVDCLDSEIVMWIDTTKYVDAAQAVPVWRTDIHVVMQHEGQLKLKIISAAGWCLHETIGDGNCWWRSVSIRIYGHQHNWQNVKNAVLRWINQNMAMAIRELMGGDAETFGEMMERMKKAYAYAGQLAMSATALCFKWKIEIKFCDFWLSRRLLDMNGFTFGSADWPAMAVLSCPRARHFEYLTPMSSSTITVDQDVLPVPGIKSPSKHNGQSGNGQSVCPPPATQSHPSNSHTKTSSAMDKKSTAGDNYASAQLQTRPLKCSKVDCDIIPFIVKHSMPIIDEYDGPFEGHGPDELYANPPYGECKLYSVRISDVLDINGHRCTLSGLRFRVGHNKIFQMELSNDVDGRNGLAEIMMIRANYTFSVADALLSSIPSNEWFTALYVAQRFPPHTTEWCTRIKVTMSFSKFRKYTYYADGRPVLVCGSIHASEIAAKKMWRHNLKQAFTEKECVKGPDEAFWYLPDNRSASVEVMVQTVRLSMSKREIAFVGHGHRKWVGLIVGDTNWMHVMGQTFDVDSWKNAPATIGGMTYSLGQLQKLYPLHGKKWPITNWNVSAKPLKKNDYIKGGGCKAVSIAVPNLVIQLISEFLPLRSRARLATCSRTLFCSLFSDAGQKCRITGGRPVSLAMCRRLFEKEWSIISLRIVHYPAVKSGLKTIEYRKFKLPLNQWVLVVISRGPWTHDDTEHFKKYKASPWFGQVKEYRQSLDAFKGLMDKLDIKGKDVFAVFVSELLDTTKQNERLWSDGSQPAMEQMDPSTDFAGGYHIKHRMSIVLRLDNPFPMSYHDDDDKLVTVGPQNVQKLAKHNILRRKLYNQIGMGAFKLIRPVRAQRNCKSRPSPSTSAKMTSPHHGQSPNANIPSPHNGQSPNAKMTSPQIGQPPTTQNGVMYDERDQEVFRATFYSPEKRAIGFGTAIKLNGMDGKILSSVLKYPRASYWSKNAHASMHDDIEVVFMQFTTSLATNCAQHINAIRHDKAIFPTEFKDRFTLIYQWLRRYLEFDAFDDFIEVNNLQPLYWCLWFMYDPIQPLLDADAQHMLKKATGNAVGDCHGTKLDAKLCEKAKVGISLIRQKMQSTVSAKFAAPFRCEVFIDLEEEHWWYGVRQLVDDPEAIDTDIAMMDNVKAAAIERQPSSGSHCSSNQPLSIESATVPRAAATQIRYEYVNTRRMRKKMENATKFQQSVMDRSLSEAQLRWTQIELDVAIVGMDLPTQMNQNPPELVVDCVRTGFLFLKTSRVDMTIRCAIYYVHLLRLLCQSAPLEIMDDTRANKINQLAIWFHHHFGRSADLMDALRINGHEDAICVLGAVLRAKHGPSSPILKQTQAWMTRFGHPQMMTFDMLAGDDHRMTQLYRLLTRLIRGQPVSLPGSFWSTETNLQRWWSIDCSHLPHTFSAADFTITRRCRLFMSKHKAKNVSHIEIKSTFLPNYGVTAPNVNPNAVYKWRQHLKGMFVHRKVVELDEAGKPKKYFRAEGLMLLQIPIAALACFMDNQCLCKKRLFQMLRHDSVAMRLHRMWCLYLHREYRPLNDRVFCVGELEDVLYNDYELFLVSVQRKLGWTIFTAESIQKGKPLPDPQCAIHAKVQFAWSLIIMGTMLKELEDCDSVLRTSTAAICNRLRENIDRPFGNDALTVLNFDLYYDDFPDCMAQKVGFMDTRQFFEGLPLGVGSQAEVMLRLTWIDLVNIVLAVASGQFSMRPIFGDRIAITEETAHLVVALWFATVVRRVQQQEKAVENALSNYPVRWDLLREDMIANPQWITYSQMYKEDAEIGQWMDLNVARPIAINELDSEHVLDKFEDTSDDEMSFGRSSGTIVQGPPLNVSPQRMTEPVVSAKSWNVVDAPKPVICASVDDGRVSHGDNSSAPPETQSISPLGAAQPAHNGQPMLGEWPNTPIMDNRPDPFGPKSQAVHLKWRDVKPRRSEWSEEDKPIPMTEEKQAELLQDFSAIKKMGKIVSLRNWEHLSDADMANRLEIYFRGARSKKSRIHNWNLRMSAVAAAVMDKRTQNVLCKFAEYFMRNNKDAGTMLNRNSIHWFACLNEVVMRFLLEDNKWKEKIKKHGVIMKWFGVRWWTNIPSISCTNALFNKDGRATTCCPMDAVLSLIAKRGWDWLNKDWENKTDAPYPIFPKVGEVDYWGCSLCLPATFNIRNHMLCLLCWLQNGSMVSLRVTRGKHREHFVKRHTGFAAAADFNYCNFHLKKGHPDDKPEKFEEYFPSADIPNGLWPDGPSKEERMAPNDDSRRSLWRRPCNGISEALKKGAVFHGGYTSPAMEWLRDFSLRRNELLTGTEQPEHEHCRLLNGTMDSEHLEGYMGSIRIDFEQVDTICQSILLDSPAFNHERINLVHHLRTHTAVMDKMSVDQSNPEETTERPLVELSPPKRRKTSSGYISNVTTDGASSVDARPVVSGTKKRRSGGLHYSSDSANTMSGHDGHAASVQGSSYSGQSAFDSQVVQSSAQSKKKKRKKKEKRKKKKKGYSSSCSSGKDLHRHPSDDEDDSGPAGPKSTRHSTKSANRKRRTVRNKSSATNNSRSRRKQTTKTRGRTGRVVPNLLPVGTLVPKFGQYHRPITSPSPEPPQLVLFAEEPSSNSDIGPSNLPLWPPRKKVHPKRQIMAAIEDVQSMSPSPSLSVTTRVEETSNMQLTITHSKTRLKMHSASKPILFSLPKAYHSLYSKTKTVHCTRRQIEVMRDGGLCALPMIRFKFIEWTKHVMKRLDMVQFIGRVVLGKDSDPEKCVEAVLVKHNICHLFVDANQLQRMNKWAHVLYEVALRHTVTHEERSALWSSPLTVSRLNKVWKSSNSSIRELQIETGWNHRSHDSVIFPWSTALVSVMDEKKCRSMMERILWTTMGCHPLRLTESRRGLNAAARIWDNADIETVVFWANHGDLLFECNRTSAWFKPLSTDMCGAPQFLDDIICPTHLDPLEKSRNRKKHEQSVQKHGNDQSFWHHLWKQSGKNLKEKFKCAVTREFMMKMSISCPQWTNADQFQAIQVSHEDWIDHIWSNMEPKIARCLSGLFMFPFTDGQKRMRRVRVPSESAIFRPVAVFQLIYMSCGRWLNPNFHAKKTKDQRDCVWGIMMAYQYLVTKSIMVAKDSSNTSRLRYAPQNGHEEKSNSLNLLLDQSIWGMSRQRKDDFRRAKKQKKKNVIMISSDEAEVDEISTSIIHGHYVHPERANRVHLDWYN